MTAGGSGDGDDDGYRYVPPEQREPFDPLRLCVFATVSLLTWLAGPAALAVFAGVGAAGYVRARRAGLLHSRCKLGDTRPVIAYLVVLAGVGVVAAVLRVVR